MNDLFGLGVFNKFLYLSLIFVWALGCKCPLIKRWKDAEWDQMKKNLINFVSYVGTCGTLVDKINYRFLNFHVAKYLKYADIPCTFELSWIILRISYKC